MSNTKQTSREVASLAGKTLGSSSASNLQKSFAGSALSQFGNGSQTSNEISVKAGHALGSKTSADNTRTLAGSVVSQTRKNK